MSARGNGTRGIYLLPNLLTTANLVLGCIAIALLFDRAEEGAMIASVLIIVAGVLDFSDGLIARLTNTTSRFGLEYDSLADMVSFGVAPAWLAYVFCLKSMGGVGLAAVVWYITCTALRLARFNTAAPRSIPGFSGLPCPAAAGSVASFVILAESIAEFPFTLNPAPFSVWSYTLLGSGVPVMLSFGLGVLGWLMVSRTPYLGFKGLALARPKPLRLMVSIVVFGFLIWSLPQLLFGIAMLYILSGLVSRMLVHVRWAEVVAPAWVEWAEAMLETRRGSPGKTVR